MSEYCEKKTCNKCNEERNITMYSYRNKSKNILFATCKICINALTGQTQDHY